MSTGWRGLLFVFGLFVVMFVVSLATCSFALDRAIGAVEHVIDEAPRQ